MYSVFILRTSVEAAGWETHSGLPSMVGQVG